MFFIGFLRVNKQEELITGTITKVERNGFVVKTDYIEAVFCTIGGKLRKNNIMLTLGDDVGIVVSEYDISRGIIKKRM